MKSYQELMSDLDQIKTDIDSARENEAKLIAERVLILLKESGVDLHAILELVSPDKQSSTRKVKPKYFDPITGRTWSGRGRLPRWLIGKNPNDYLILSKNSKK